jgi:hypothetical protein
VDRAAAEEWIGEHVEPAGEIEVMQERPWATVLRVPLRDGASWFKACAPVQAFEPQLTDELALRWPDRVVEVIATDVERAWLLLRDGGTPLQAFGDALEAWLEVLPLYAELQRGETAHVDEHLAAGVPDLRIEKLPAAYEQAVVRDLPLEPEEIERLRAFAPRVVELCSELASRGIPPSIQHDDLHDANVYARDGRFAILDWGDASIAHPFTTLTVTFRLLEYMRGVPPGDPWFARLRDAYLEPWGAPAELAETFDLAEKVGRFSHTLSWLRQLDAMPAEERPQYTQYFPKVLRRFLEAVQG